MRQVEKEQNRMKVHVPLSFVMRGGRKAIVLNNTAPAQRSIRLNEPLVKALAKAFRWRRLIEEGKFSSITELAKAHHVNQSYACRMPRLTLLAPQLIEEALNGRCLRAKELKRFWRPLPTDRNLQLELFLE